MKNKNDDKSKDEAKKASININDGKDSISVNRDGDNVEININGSLDELTKKIEELEKDKSELKDQLQSQVASERNSLKRRDAVEQELIKYRSKDLGQLIIPHLELSKKVLTSLEKSDNVELINYLQGFSMILKQMDDALEEVGIKKIPLNVGDKFDEKTQEAIEMVDSNEFKPNTIVEIVNDGYMIHDKVLVHAKVKVAKKPNSEEDNQENKGE